MVLKYTRRLTAGGFITTKGIVPSGYVHWQYSLRVKNIVLLDQYRRTKELFQTRNNGGFVLKRILSR